MDDSDVKVLKRVSVKEAFSDVRTPEINVLDFFRGDVLALTKFVDVFLAVDNFEGSVRQNNADVSTVVPAFLINSLFSVGLVQIISFKH